jgi:hypothetical protein
MRVTARKMSPQQRLRRAPEQAAAGAPDVLRRQQPEALTACRFRKTLLTLNPPSPEDFFCPKNGIFFTLRNGSFVLLSEHGILMLSKLNQKGIAMSLTKSWYTIEEAVSKFGLSSVELQEMIDCGLVRTEEYKGKAVMLNGDDIEQQLNMVPSV